MTYPNTSAARWFGRATADDQYYLNAWRDAPQTYSAGQEFGPDWNADHYEVVLGVDHSGDFFRQAAQLVLKNKFYPPDVMHVVSDFGNEERPVAAGDRVLQRIHLLQFVGYPVFDVLTMNEITEVIDEPRRAGFTYTTTAAHSEIGEWSPLVVWRENGEVALVIDVVSRTRPGMPRPLQKFSRRMQLRAHRLSIIHFQTLLNGYQREKVERFPSEVLPVGLVGAALMLLGLLLAGYRRQSSRPDRR